MHTYIGTDNAVSTKTSTEKENSGLLGDYLHRETVRHWVSTLSSTTRSHGELCCCISLTVELGCAPGKKYCEPNNITLSGRDLSGLLASIFSWMTIFMVTHRRSVVANFILLGTIDSDRDISFRNAAKSSSKPKVFRFRIRRFINYYWFLTHCYKTLEYCTSPTEAQPKGKHREWNTSNVGVSVSDCDG